MQTRSASTRTRSAGVEVGRPRGCARKNWRNSGGNEIGRASTKETGASHSWSTPATCRQDEPGRSANPSIQGNGVAVPFVARATEDGMVDVVRDELHRAVPHEHVHTPHMEAGEAAVRLIGTGVGEVHRGAVRLLGGEGDRKFDEKAPPQLSPSALRSPAMKVVLVPSVKSRKLVRVTPRLNAPG